MDWNGIPCDMIDRDLFYVSTVVTVGKGDMASFWFSAWLNGESPRNIAPSLFKTAIRKKISVQDALNNNRWVKLVLPIQSVQEIKEYVELWERLANTYRNPQNEDEITRRWTINGEYTAKSAYRIQFVGDYNKLRISAIWKAKAEPKCRFFAWTLLHGKILTADNLQKEGMAKRPGV